MSGKKIRYNPPCHYRQPKPAWVKKEIIYLKAMMPYCGCRTIAHQFNRRHQEKHGMTVSKSYVYQVFIKHNHDIHQLRRELKRRPPKKLPAHKIWAMDLTKLLLFAHASSLRSRLREGGLTGRSRSRATGVWYPAKAV